jgi:hypothetical protein
MNDLYYINLTSSYINSLFLFKKTTLIFILFFIIKLLIKVLNNQLYYYKF